MNQKELQNNIIQAVKEVQIKEQDEDVKRDFFGKKGDEFFFIAIDPEGRLSILDAEDNEVLGFEDVDIDVDSENKEKDFLIAAAQNIDIDTISFPLVTKFNLLGLEKKEDEPEEKKEPEEEVEPEEDKEVKPEEEIEEVPESKEDKEKNTNFGDLRKEVQNMVEQDEEDIIREVTEFILKPEVFKTKQEAIEHIQEFFKERVTEIFLNPGGEGFRVAVLEGKVPDDLRDKLGDKIKKLKEDIKVFRTSDQIFKTREEAEEFVKTSTKGGVLINVPGKGFQVGFKELNIRSEDTIEVEPELDRKERSSAERDSNESIKGDLKKYKEDVKKATKKVKDLEDKLKKEKVKENKDIKTNEEEVIKGVIERDEEFVVVAKGLDTKEFAEKVAKDRDKGKVIQDSDDPNKFAVVVMKERQDNIKVIARDLKTKGDAEVVARSKPRTKVIRDPQDKTKYSVIQVKESEGTKESIEDLLKKHNIK